MILASFNPIDNPERLLCVALFTLCCWLLVRLKRSGNDARYRASVAAWDQATGADVVRFENEAEKTGGKNRSPQWPALRRNFLLAHPTCAACGGTENLEVHHVHPFNEHPDLELEPSNLCVLCEHPSRTCHWHFGHNALEWKTCNPHVRLDAAQFLERRSHAA